MEHNNHNKKRLYARNQSSNAKQWERTALFLCECGAVLETKLTEKKTMKLTKEKSIKDKTEDSLKEVRSKFGTRKNE